MKELTESKDFQRLFGELTTNRTCDIWTKTHKHSKELKELERQENELCKKLEETLNDDENKLLEKYQELKGMEVAYLRHIIYELGYRDGLNFAYKTDEDLINSDPIIVSSL